MPAARRLLLAGPIALLALGLGRGASADTKPAPSLSERPTLQKVKPSIARRAGSPSVREMPPKLAKVMKQPATGWVWKHADCTQAGPVEFPHLVLWNASDGTFPSGTLMFYIHKGKVGQEAVTSPLAAGESIVGPSFEAYAPPGVFSCAAAAKVPQPLPPSGPTD